MFQAFRRLIPDSNRTRYLVNLTSLMALALISNVAYLHLSNMRSYLSRHVGFETYMGISQVRITSSSYESNHIPIK